MKFAETPPSLEQVKCFCNQFTPREWDLLCRHRAFTQSLMENLVLAACEAAEILHRPIPYSTALVPFQPQPLAKPPKMAPKRFEP